MRLLAYPNFKADAGVLGLDLGVLANLAIVGHGDADFVTARLQFARQRYKHIDQCAWRERAAALPRLIMRIRMEWRRKRSTLNV